MKSTLSTRLLKTFNRQWNEGEHRYLMLSLLVMGVATSLPYFFGYYLSSADVRFMGIVTATPDTAQYLAWMRGFESSFFIDNHLTAEPSASVFFNLLWWTLAQIKTLLRLEPMQVMQLYRLFAVIFFGVVLYWFLRIVVKNKRNRKGSFLVAYFGSGLGWIWVVLKYSIAQGKLLFPQDLYMSEPNSFLSLSGFNHFSFSAALMMLIYGWTILSYERRDWRYLFGVGTAAVVLGWEHAYDLLLVYTITGSFLLLLTIRDEQPRKTIKLLLVLIGPSFWAALYSLFITNRFPVWKEVLAQFENAGAWTPDPLHLLVLMGLPLMTALITFKGIVPLQDQNNGQLFIRLWFLINFFLVYVPLNFQIHYVNGWQIPISILAVDGYFQHLEPWVLQKMSTEYFHGRVSARVLAHSVPVIALLSVMLTNVYLFSWRFLFLSRYPHGNFIFQSEADAMDWLADHAEQDDVVLSGRGLGQFVPSWVGAKSFLGHWAMTLDLYKKEEMVRRMFSEAVSDSERLVTISEYSVDYVLYGSEERSFGNHDLGHTTFLFECFRKADTYVYCVRENFRK